MVKPADLLSQVRTAAEVRCPRCGCVARVAVVQRARVRCEIDPDGTVGRVLSMSREASIIDAYECGGGHVWKVDQVGRGGDGEEARGEPRREGEAPRHLGREAGGQAV